MNDERLYIDGVLADLGEQTRITLSLNSNLFRDISKMAGNFSYTIKLPNTAHNRQLIENSDTLNMTTLYPYGTHTADYYRNGAGVVLGAKAVLLSVKDDIEISLSWGVTEGLRRLATEGLTLNQLPDDLSITWVLSNYPVPLWSAIENHTAWNDTPILYAMSNYFKPKDQAEEQFTCPYIRPCVRVPHILHTIEQYYGLTLDFSAVWDAIKYLALPLTGIKALYNTDCDTIEVTSFIAPPEGVTLAYKIVSSAGVFGESVGVEVTRLSVVNSTKDVVLNLTLTGQYARPQGDTYTDAVVRVVRYNAQDVQQGYDDVEIVITDTTPSYVTLTATATLAYTMAAGEYLTITIASDTLDDPSLVASGFIGSTFEGREDTGGSDESYDDKVPEVVEGNAYPAYPNLPSVKITDFIKTLCALAGAFPKNQQGNTIEFLPFGVLWDNIPSAYDWTRRIEPSAELDKPREIAYKMGEYAQNNWYRYTGEDDAYKGEADGNLPVPNTTLDLSKDFFKLPFAPSPCEVVRRWVRIPIYTLENYDALIEGTSGTPVYKANDVKPRIVKLAKEIFKRRPTDPYYTIATFDGLSMQQAIATKYQDIQNALSYCVVIKETIRLTDLELQAFDETIPVYLAQYGAYFAVTEIRADDEGNADVTLFKISEQFVQPQPEPPTPDIPVPTITPDAGSILPSATITISITSPATGAEYSFDNDTWIPYSAPFTLASDSTVYARATDGNGNYSEVVSNAYTILPYDAVVEYIDLPSGAYFTTDIIPTDTHGLMLDFKTYNTSDRVYMGSRNSSTRFYIGAATNLYQGWGNYTALGVANNQARHKVALNLYNSRVGAVDDVNKTNLSTLSYSPAYSIYIGVQNSSGSAAANKPPSVIYAAQITNGSNLVFDGIPVRKDGKGCLYDRVSGTLFENAGTGTITYGNDIN